MIFDHDSHPSVLGKLDNCRNGAGHGPRRRVEFAMSSRRNDTALRLGTINPICPNPMANSSPHVSPTPHQMNRPTRSTIFWAQSQGITILSPTYWKAQRSMYKRKTTTRSYFASEEISLSTQRMMVQVTSTGVIRGWKWINRIYAHLAGT